MKIEQGDLLKGFGVAWFVIVISKTLSSICPIVKDALEGPLHIPLKNCPMEGYVLCEQVRSLDLSARRFSRITAAPDFDIMDISDAVMGMFDYQQLS